MPQTKWSPEFRNTMISDIFVFHGCKQFEETEDAWLLEKFGDFFAKIKTPEEFEKRIREEELQETPVGRMSIYVVFYYHRYLFLFLRKGKNYTATDAEGAWEQYLKHMKAICDLEIIAKKNGVPKEERSGPERVIAECRKRLETFDKYTNEEIDLFCNFSKNYVAEFLGRKEN